MHYCHRKGKRDQMPRARYTCRPPPPVALLTTYQCTIKPFLLHIPRINPHWHMQVQQRTSHPASQAAGPFHGNDTEQPVVLILVGLIGSGKSTFAHALEQHAPRFRRCNQDDLGNRQRVEASARACLREGLSVCIDRTNFDARQRATWIRIAREFPGTDVWVLVFDTPYAVCAQRLRERTDHPTIKTPEDALSILARFHSDYQAPAAHEGYTRLLSLSASEQLPVYTREDVLGILARVRDAPPPPELQTPITGWSDRGRGGYRGWREGGGRGYWRGARGDFQGAARRGAYMQYDRPRDGPNIGADQREDIPGQAYSPGRGSTFSGSWRRGGGESSGPGHQGI
ncbi:P-loop containing nucleoside triphosphate hydrolase protein [Fomitopsis betulina]|nr:P-loop containing nucleoside triphosphate hydrolase protein [Fomitopsis betulina]